MLKDNDRIPAGIFFALMVGGIIEIGLLTLPRTLGVAVGNDAFLVVPPLFLLALLGFWGMVRLAALFPQETLIDYLPRILGRWTGKALSALIIVFWILTLARIVRTFGDMVRVHMLWRTPVEVIHLSMLLVCAYLARHGIEAIGRAVLIVIMLVFPIMAIMILLPSHTAAFTRLLPLFSSGLTPIVLATVRSLGALEGIEIVLMLFPFLASKSKCLRTGSLAIASTALVVFITVALSWAVLGVENLSLTRPTLTLVQEVEMPTIFLEQLTILFVGIWVPQLFATISIFLYIASLATGRLLGMKEHKHLTLPLIPIIYLLSVYPINTLEVEQFEQVLQIAGGFFYVPLIFILLAIAWARGFRRPVKGGLLDGTP